MKNKPSTDEELMNQRNNAENPVTRSVLDSVVAKRVEKKEGYFPIRVLYTETQERAVVDHPSDLRNNASFKVLETNYDG